MKTVTVDADALKRVLLAFNGPGYMLRELQVTRGGSAAGLLDNNPIDTLEKQYLEAYQKQRKENDDRPLNKR